MNNTIHPQTLSTKIRQKMQCSCFTCTSVKDTLWRQYIANTYICWGITKSH